MSAPNGHGAEDRGNTFAPSAMLPGPAMAQLPTERVKEIVAALEVPFDSAQIEWRVTNTTKGQQPARGQVVPYADQRAYTDRLNALFTPAGWTRKYFVHTSANYAKGGEGATGISKEQHSWRTSTGARRGTRKRSRYHPDCCGEAESRWDRHGNARAAGVRPNDVGIGGGARDAQRSMPSFGRE